MYTYELRGDLSELHAATPRIFVVETDDQAILRLASILGVRMAKQSKRIKRRSRKKIRGKISREIHLKFGMITLWRGSVKVFPRLKERKVEPKKNGVFRKRRPVRHAWLAAA